MSQEGDRPCVGPPDPSRPGSSQARRPGRSRRFNSAASRGRSRADVSYRRRTRGTFPRSSRVGSSPTTCRARSRARGAQRTPSPRRRFAKPTACPPTGSTEAHRADSHVTPNGAGKGVARRRERVDETTRPKAVCNDARVNRFGDIYTPLLPHVNSPGGPFEKFFTKSGCSHKRSTMARLRSGLETHWARIRAGSLQSMRSVRRRTVEEKISLTVSEVFVITYEATRYAL